MLAKQELKSGWMWSFLDGLPEESRYVGSRPALRLEIACTIEPFTKDSIIVSPASQLSKQP